VRSKTRDGEQRLTKDVYARVTDRIIADLEKGIRPWLKPWHAEHAAGKITRPLRHNGTPYRGIKILLLWGEAMAKGYTTPIWMTFKQALEVDAHVRKGEHGSLFVFANTVTRTERDENGDDVPFMKGYTVFNCEQIEGLPQHYYARPENPLPASERIEIDGGAGKWGHYGREKGASDVVTLWPAASARKPNVKWQFFRWNDFRQASLSRRGRTCL
jgi:antirestriction protein ArdC